MASENPVKFDLSTICSALGRVRTEWFRIGIQLGIPRSKLKEFKKDEEDPLSAVVDYCLQGNTTQPLSWQSIVEALKSEYVGEPGIAEEIKMKYCQQVEQADDSSAATSKHEQAKKEDGEVNKDSTTNQQSSPSFVSKLDPAVRMDLEWILDKNIKQIGTIFATYAATVRYYVEKKGVTKETLIQFLLSLPATSTSLTEKNVLYALSDIKDELKRCTTITEIFELLQASCITFLNYDIFPRILQHFEISEDDERLKYHDKLIAFINKHTISEFEKYNPLLKKYKKGTTELILKFDIEATCKLARVIELKKVIADIMDLSPSALQIVDIEDGCIVVTFLLPASVANILFTPNTVFTPQQEDKLRAASVLWIKCNGQTFDFEVTSKRTNPALEKLKEQVTCSVCLGVYTDPKLLQCNHTYCQQCLQGLVQQDQQGQLPLTCPT